MKTLTHCVFAFALSFGSLSSQAYASDEHSGMDMAKHATAAAKTDSSAKSSDAYPLDTCIVSGEKLGDMGAPIDFTYQEAGKPDRLVRFCCKSCLKTFKKDPASYLKKLDEATAAKSAKAAK